MNKMNYSQDVIDRFWSKVKYPGNDQYCWEWTAGLKGKKNHEYGTFQLASYISIYAHRFSWEFYNGPIPNDLQVLHTCDNTKCVNPEHLFLGTNYDNVQDKISKNRQTKGSKNGWLHVLTENDVEEMIIKIYNKEFSTINQIANHYGIDRSVISHILNGEAWTHVTDNLQIPLSQIQSMIVQSKFSNRLNEDIVREIKIRLQTHSMASTARVYNISESVIHKINYGKIWSQVTI
jgi:hypothetical protein